MGRYLTDLADVCRRTGFPVLEVDDWPTRARGGAGGDSTGGYESGAPSHIIVHHTASGPSSDGWPDVNYMVYGHQDAPCGNLYLARDGTIWVMAGGAANTNGSGHDPCGIVSDDNMNAKSIAIEAGNDGTGEPWPEPQQSCYVVLCAELGDAYGIGAGQVHAHFEWAPARKIDPAGESAYAAGSAMWNMDAFREDVALGGGAPPPEPEPTPPPTPEEDDDMTPFLIRNRDNGGIALVYGDGKVTGLDGDSLPEFIARYGDFIDMPPGTYDDFARKGG